jgi:hypothetical protein
MDFAKSLGNRGGHFGPGRMGLRRILLGDSATLNRSLNVVYFEKQARVVILQQNAGQHFLCISRLSYFLERCFGSAKSSREVFKV